MKALGKLCLLLVVIGWFCPVACQISGPQWVKSAVNGEMGFQYAICAVSLFVSMAMALIGILLFIISFIRKERNKDGVATTILSGVFGLPFLLIMVINSSTLEVLNVGAYLMIAGWLSSLVFLRFGRDDE